MKMSRQALFLLVIVAPTIWTSNANDLRAATKDKHPLSKKFVDPVKNRQKDHAGRGEALAHADLSNSNDPILPTLSNVRYGPHERNVLNFWKAESDKPTPVLFLIHGGGWIIGAKAESFSPSSNDLLKADAVGAECDILVRTNRRKSFYDSAMGAFLRAKLLAP